MNNQRQYQLWGANGTVAKIKTKLDSSLGSDMPV